MELELTTLRPSLSHVPPTEPARHPNANIFHLCILVLLSSTEDNKGALLYYKSHIFCHLYYKSHIFCHVVTGTQTPIWLSESVTWYSDPSVIPSHTVSGLWLIEFSKSMAFHFQYQVIGGNAASSLAAHLFFPSLHLHPLLLSSLSPGLFSVGKPVAMSWGHLDCEKAHMANNWSLWPTGKKDLKPA